MSIGSGQSISTCIKLCITSADECTLGPHPSTRIPPQKSRCLGPADTESFSMAMRWLLHPFSPSRGWTHHQVPVHKLSCLFMQHEASGLSRELCPGLARYRLPRRCQVLDVDSQHAPRSCRCSARTKRSMSMKCQPSIACGFHPAISMGFPELWERICYGFFCCFQAYKYSLFSQVSEPSISSRTFIQQIGQCELTAEYHHVYRPRQRD